MAVFLKLYRYLYPSFSAGVAGVTQSISSLTEMVRFKIVYTDKDGPIFL